ncbi:hypothetical protein Lal_00039561 [Lupinus albus]|nr:hypothetical protein Lal_00039561 [Lupinus albus]
MHAGEARDHGRMVTPSGAGTSGVDDPARGKRMVTGVLAVANNFEEKRERRAFQEQGALGLILELEKRVDMNNEKDDASKELMEVITLRNPYWLYVNLGPYRKDIVLDMKTSSSICCDIPMIGDITGFGLEEIERRKQQSLGETIKNRDILSVGYLTLEDRLLHYFLTYVILPKFSNHSQISDIKLQLMYAIKFNIKVRPKWPSIFAKARLILRLSTKIGFFINHVTHRTYKHRTDRQPAPTNKPEPTAKPN